MDFNEHKQRVMENQIVLAPIPKRVAHPQQVDLRSFRINGGQKKSSKVPMT